MKFWERILLGSFILFFTNVPTYSFIINLNYKANLSKAIDRCIYSFLNEKKVARVYFDKRVVYQFKYYKVNEFTKMLSSAKHVNEVSLYYLFNDYFYVDRRFDKEIGLLKHLTLQVDYDELEFSKSPSLVLGVNLEKFLEEMVKTQTKIFVGLAKNLETFLLVKPVEPLQISSDSFLMSFIVINIPAYHYKSKTENRWFIDYSIIPFYLYEDTSFYVFKVVFNKNGKPKITKKWEFYDESYY